MTDNELPRPFILLIDHQQKVLDEIASVLNQSGLDCRCCTTAEEAITAVEAGAPDLIVCDVNLEGESGLETCRQLKQLPGMEGVPVMLLSSAQLPDVIRRSHDDDCVYCLRKPPAPKVFIELVDQALAAKVADSTC